MCLLLETIKITNGIINNIDFHNLRFNKSRLELFDVDNKIDLEKIIKNNGDYLNIVNDNIVKCRIIYDTEIKEVKFEKYIKREIKTLKIVFDNSIEYNYKYFNRDKLNLLLQKKQNCDDIIIVKNNLITDTSFSNIVFYNGINYVTPLNPLLKGTKREKLLKENKIIEEKININELKKFKYAILINSMLELDDNNKILIENIF